LKPARWERALTAVELCALAGVLVALEAGAPATRWRPVAIFLGIGAAAALYREVGVALTRARVRHQSTAPVPRNRWLRKPAWISAIEATSFLGLAIPFAAGAAAVGFPGVGLGILATMAGLAAFTSAMSSMFSVAAFMLEQDGLRVRIRGATLLVPWSMVADVRREGSEDHRLVVLDLVGVRAIRASVDPATRKTHARAALVFSSEDGVTSKLVLAPWTAGLDGTALARALISARGPDSVPAN